MYKNSSIPSASQLIVCELLFIIFWIFSMHQTDECMKEARKVVKWQREGETESWEEENGISEISRVVSSYYTITKGNLN